MTSRPPSSQAFTPRRARRAIAPPPRAGVHASKLLGDMRSRYGPSFADIVAHWPEIAGERAAKLCSPAKLTGRGARGVLHVRARGPGAMLIEADAPRLLDRVNTYCGTSVAGRIAIVRAPARERDQQRRRTRPGLSPAAAQELDERLAHIDDPRLKAALKDLGAKAITSGADGIPDEAERER